MYYWHVCYQVVFKGFNSLNLFPLQQQPKGALARGDTAGGLETTSPFGNDASTVLDRISGDDAPPKVCMCVLCVGMQCNIPQRSYIHLSENASQNNAI